MKQIRAQFPALHQSVHGHSLVYLDSAATTQKPASVILAESDFYEHHNANVHRGVHLLSQLATDQFEAVRVKLAEFINAPDPATVLWTKGCTEAINLVAHSWGSTHLASGDVILLSAMEHHANIVPWQLIAERMGAQILPFPISDEGDILLPKLEALLQAHPVKMVGVKHVCNALGTVNPVAAITRLAHAYGARVLIDGAQGLAHCPLDVTLADVDFYAMSAHKAYGPTGVGALYGKRELLEAMPPYQGGGDMIRTVSWEGTTYNDLPNKFEPGTPNIAGVIAFGAAIDFLNRIEIQDRSGEARREEASVLTYGTELLKSIPGVRLIGEAQEKVGVLSFVMERAHPHDIGTILDRQGIAIRTGHHCCMPLMKRLGVPATARASLAIYSTREELDGLAAGITKVKELFG